ncbi:D-aminoacyl-tRNA deacylase [Apilactobacillus micheneri]|uniref:D-aminoacyl-tRNA deacylase n=1 Tax=Apilactobacillus micheneri TaxID=1899430 RepID=A0A9Q8MU33_9LACO|nr:D-aminoacyl-tRNA deacylase [Apilactobacillus micheneri]TPR40716.1 D-tyrosyl-tRNA(Tyr) deacylase [Apilactobacillus micheneri]TPR42183.1 D-tyrosyl-tRNA(Tyr) deacylase [Apilactobacillus micheneri]TPR44838.1 D-tyrosyl-tRNA(Tyr) deacylase [Apilactobacillus micheneri]TPR45137.1 D-tyrosyl-tRNA(Tyr) deacylase [Apilactobacillus micheneri]TPR46479.1 D-tyrosyl-tRNA(Tyr) deacylase [Apilactobacillus micheneri]
MKVVLQRVNKASVSINDHLFNKINKGYLLLVGIKDSDSSDDIDYLVRKITNLRIFEDDNGKTNLNLSSVNGEILSISQFTLYANTKHGNRPSFVNAGGPNFASEMYDSFNQKLLDAGNSVKTGQFGADMQIDLQNDGPFTIVFDTENN